MTTLAQLSAALEAATEGSREIDAMVAEVLGAEVTRNARGDWRIRNVPWLNYDTSHWMALDHYSTSLDAVTALIEAKFEGHHWIVEKGKYDYRTTVSLGRIRIAPTAPLAALKALISAMSGGEWEQNP